MVVAVLIPNITFLPIIMMAKVEFCRYFRDIQAERAKEIGYFETSVQVTCIEQVTPSF